MKSKKIIMPMFVGFALLIIALVYYGWWQYHVHQTSTKMLHDISTMPYNTELHYDFVLDGVYSLDLLSKKQLEYGVDFGPVSTNPEINMIIEVLKEGAFVQKYVISEVFGSTSHGRESYNNGWEVWRFKVPDYVPRGKVLIKIKIAMLDHRLIEDFGPLAISIHKSSNMLGVP